MRGEPKLDFEGLEQINRALKIPLVIHGGTGLCDGLWGSAGKAADVLDASEPWAPIEHLIIYDVKGIDEQGVAMMAEDRRMLAAIPGVRAVITGEELKAGSAYPYTWLVNA